jgi:hypothetical protein
VATSAVSFSVASTNWICGIWAADYLSLKKKGAVGPLAAGSTKRPSFEYPWAGHAGPVLPHDRHAAHRADFLAQMRTVMSVQHLTPEWLFAWPDFRAS